MTKKQARMKLDKLQMYLGMARYRKASFSPGPSIDEDEARILKQIKQLKKEYNL